MSIIRQHATAALVKQTLDKSSLPHKICYIKIQEESIIRPWVIFPAMHHYSGTLFFYKQPRFCSSTQVAYEIGRFESKIRGHGY